jgi:hypothetical protein
MRNTTSRLAIAAVMALGLAGPALADVTVTVDVTKDKNISVTETLTVTKIIFIDIEVDPNSTGRPRRWLWSIRASTATRSTGIPTSSAALTTSRLSAAR